MTPAEETAMAEGGNGAHPTERLITIIPREGAGGHPEASRGADRGAP